MRIAYSTRNDISVRRTVPVRQVQGVQGVVPMVPEPPDKTHGRLRVDQEFHAVRGSARFTCASRAA